MRYNIQCHLKRGNAGKIISFVFLLNLSSILLGQLSVVTIIYRTKAEEQKPSIKSL
jgi:hypothetical protein